MGTKINLFNNRLLSLCAGDTPQVSNDVYNQRYTSEKVARRSKQSGRSMIEMLGVLAIIGVLTVGSIAGYAKAMERHKINNLKEQLYMITSNILTTFQSQHNYAALSSDKNTGTSLAVDLGIIPHEMVQPDGSVIHSFNGRVYVYAVDYAGIPNGAFTIDLEGLPRNVAIDLAMSGDNESNRQLMNVLLSTTNN